MVLGDKVRQQTAPNKDVQKEIADVTEVKVVARQPGCCWGAADPPVPVPVHSPWGQQPSPSGGRTR